MRTWACLSCISRHFTTPLPRSLPWDTAIYQEKTVPKSSYVLSLWSAECSFSHIVLEPSHRSSRRTSQQVLPKSNSKTFWTESTRTTVCQLISTSRSCPKSRQKSPKTSRRSLTSWRSCHSASKWRLICTSIRTRTRTSTSSRSRATTSLPGSVPCWNPHSSPRISTFTMKMTLLTPSFTW